MQSRTLESVWVIAVRGCVPCPFLSNACALVCTDAASLKVYGDDWSIAIDRAAPGWFVQCHSLWSPLKRIPTMSSSSFIESAKDNVFLQAT